VPHSPQGKQPADHHACRARLNAERVAPGQARDALLRHGAPATSPPIVSTMPGERSLQLYVRDFGPSIDQARLAHRREALDRPDAACQRSIGGLAWACAGWWRWRTAAACRSAVPGPSGR
jgi:hypothetical protein